MNNPRIVRQDSAAGAVRIFKSASTDVELPEGITLRNDEERVIWGQFSRARAVDSWRAFDLVLIAKLVRIEYDIRMFQRQLEEQGPIVTSPRGTPIENPIYRIIDMLLRQQLAIIRSMSLGQTLKDPRTLNKQAVDDAQAVKTIKDMGAASLLASPLH